MPPGHAVFVIHLHLWLHFSSVLTHFDGKLLLLQNPGKMSRHWIAGLANGCRKIGVDAVTLELSNLNPAIKANAAEAMTQVNSILVEHRIRAVVGYATNTLTQLPFTGQRSYFEVRGIPQLFLWADHPQWVFDKSALQPDIQVAFRSGNTHHFLKSEAHAYELTRILGWPNTHELPLAADTDVLRPATGITPDFDVVAIFGGNHKLPAWTLPFLSQNDPDVREMDQVLAIELRKELAALWTKDAPPDLHAPLTAVGERLIALKLAAPTTATARHLPLIAAEFPNALWWLTLAHPTYFRMAEILWKFRSWQRSFIPAFLAKTFRVGCFGGDWSAVPSVTSAGWVDFEQMPSVFARGHVSLNVVTGFDEEGVTAKTFEIAAGGTAILNNACRGLDALYERDREILIFDTPAQARERVQAMLDSPSRRAEIGSAGRARTERDHTWGHRVTKMLSSVDSIEP